MTDPLARSGGTPPVPPRSTYGSSFGPSVCTRSKLGCKPRAWACKAQPLSRTRTNDWPRRDSVSAVPQLEDATGARRTSSGPSPSSVANTRSRCPDWLFSTPYKPSAGTKIGWVPITCGCRVRRWLCRPYRQWIRTRTMRNRPAPSAQVRPDRAEEQGLLLLE